MRYTRATGVGLISAVAAAAVYTGLKVGWGYLYMRLVLVPRAEAASGGWSWDASYPQSLDLRGPLVIGFALGVWWMLRRRATATR